MDSIEILFSVFLGVGLAAAAGFRVFLPLLVLSLAGFYDVIPLNESWEWAGSLTAVITLGVATLVEIFGYFIPWFDNALDTIAVPLAAVAGTAVMMATVSDLSPLVTWALAIIAGGGTAAAIKGNVSAVRLTSSATTGGLANPVVSTVETGTSTVMSLLSVFIAPLAFVLVLVIFFGIYKFYKKLQKKGSSST
ncbi:DUF4126 domain-containing protein [Ulvibacter litoralis]|uniref:DUF4126 domain-containing protein n=1 Tax=Ulvibacter litoralis TaxID=227084 RepID=A0A1G7FSL9_9FLAO|nr:DUF4126 domain-containing protein [Ulvibacter litoralis]GHC63649.1 hypothetical protein GCM10008083_31190 [Ulvibacter litoralis]SDE78874.1 protein of unknown function [Ulvibacter litoralis]